MGVDSGLDQRLNSLTSVFQPIVDLRTGLVVAHEALTRWSAFPDTSPEQIFDVARTMGVVDELDRRCISSAVTTAAQFTPADHPPRTLFVNIEADSMSSQNSSTSARHLGELLRAGGSGVRPVAEFAERSLLTDPARLLRSADQLRSGGIAIALDDVGADPDSMVVLPLLSPEVIKLDRSLLDDNLSPDRLTTLLAVLAYSSRFDVALIAEGIETERQKEKAIAWGAAYGQGFHLGRPAPIDSSPTSLFPVEPRWSVPRPLTDILDDRNTDTTSITLLTSISDHLLDFAMTASETLTIVIAFREPELCSTDMARKLQHLAHRHPYVKALDAPRALFMAADRVRHAELVQPSQRIGAIAVIGQRFYCALVARPVDPDNSESPSNQWMYFFTVDPAEVCDVARTLIVHSTSPARPGPDRPTDRP
ncbi:EAL domain-containing protein [Rhodococcoides fascians A25f]|nr:EAL domain-containing protein [Rhodococcus fascians A25f]